MTCFSQYLAGPTSPHSLSPSVSNHRRTSWGAQFEASPYSRRSNAVNSGSISTTSTSIVPPTLSASLARARVFPPPPPVAVSVAPLVPPLLLPPPPLLSLPSESASFMQRRKLK